MSDRNRLKIEAEENSGTLTNNSYPGRFLCLGLSDNGNSIIQLYGITARSPKSKNRRLAVKAQLGEVRTEVVDHEMMKGEDTSLLIYKAMAHDGNGCYAVSNGEQTEDVLKYGGTPLGINQAAFLAEWKYEPDTPNFTPRISGVSLLRKNRTPMHRISVLNKNPSTDECQPMEHSFLEFCPGVGYLVSTYTGDGNPLPAFRGVPCPFPLIGDVDTILHTVWDMLPPDKRVSIVARQIDVTTGLITSTKAVNLHEPHMVTT